MSDTTTVRERPILFSGEMVRAILEGRKGQTRRVIRPGAKLPYQHADRLYVRETWGVGCRPCPHRGWVDGIEYRADEAYLEGPDLLPLNSDVEPPDAFEWDAVKEGWKPSIHMPKWAARLWLVTTAARVEPLQEISEEDCLAEGVEGIECGHGAGELTGAGYNCTDCYNSGWIEPPRLNFLQLWDSLNAKRGFPWASNPDVLVVEFEVAA